jgi:proline racemase
MVGALLTPPIDPACVAGVIFFDRTMVLGMCGHGSIGLVETLARLGRIGPGEHAIETPVGVVRCVLGDDGRVSIDNVVSRRIARDVRFDVPGVGAVAGDVAYGGNVFFLVSSPAIDLSLPRTELLRIADDIRVGVHAAGHPDVDHVELYGPPLAAGAHSRNFVLCPGKAYDRSPCGTGTSAKLACLAADGDLEEGEEWVQQSVIGSTFSARYRWLDRATGRIAPTIGGRAYVNAESTLLLDPADPFCWGIR